MADRHWASLVEESRDWTDIALERLQQRPRPYGRIAEAVTSARDLSNRALALVPVVPAMDPHEGWVGMGLPDDVQDPEPAPEPAPQWPDPREYLRGHASWHHWDQGPQFPQGDPRCLDWYAAPRGTWFGWPIPLVVSSIVVPIGRATPMVVAFGACPEGEWQGWSFLWGHVEHSVQAGYHPAFEPFAQVGATGLEDFAARGLEPAHHHFAVDAPGGASWTPDGKGDIDAASVLQALGFTITWHDYCVSPQDYEQGRARGGYLI